MVNDAKIMLHAQFSMINGHKKKNCFSFKGSTMREFKKKMYLWCKPVID